MFMFGYYVCKFYSNERIPLYRTYWIIMLILLSIPMLYIILNQENIIMDLDKDELIYTRNQEILRALEVFERRDDYVVPSSDMDEAIKIAIKYLKKFL